MRHAARLFSFMFIALVAGLVLVRMMDGLDRWIFGG